MDKVVYTNEAPKDDLFENLINLLSKFVREISTREEDGVDDSR